MKRTKAQPSLLGLMLVVTGMLLLSIVLLNLGNSTVDASGSSGWTLGLGGAGLICLLAGGFLSARKRA